MKRVVLSATEGWSDLDTYHTEVTTALEQALVTLAAQDANLAAEFQARKRYLSQMKRKFHLRHLRRLQKGSTTEFSVE